jgi:hypothetical protein
MAMTMNGEVQLAAPREAVWTKLNDPEVLKACIPGCEELERTEDNGFRAVAKMKVGPVSARFKGRVTLSDLDPPNGYKISGEGEGGAEKLGVGRGDEIVMTKQDYPNMIHAWKQRELREGVQRRKASLTAEGGPGISPGPPSNRTGEACP